MKKILIMGASLLSILVAKDGHCAAAAPAAGPAHHVTETNGVVTDIIRKIKRGEKVVSLRNRRLTLQNVKDLADALRDSAVISIDLSSSQIGVDGVSALAPSLPPGLKQLVLFWNEIGDEGLVALAPNLPPSLKNIDLSNNEIKNGGIIALADHLPPDLEILVLSWNEIGDKGVAVLADHLPPDLEILVLSFNKIGDAGITALAEMLPKTNIRDLYLDKTSITKAGVTSLTKILPRTHIEKLGLNRIDITAENRKLIEDILNINKTEKNKRWERRGQLTEWGHSIRS